VQQDTGTVHTRNQDELEADRDAALEPGRDTVTREIRGEDAQQTGRFGNVIGAEIRDVRGQELGEIESVELSSGGEIAYAIISTERSAGLNGKMFQLPWKHIRVDEVNGYYVLDVERERLNDPTLAFRQ
jgi:hypothetical protein